MITLFFAAALALRGLPIQEEFSSMPFDERAVTLPQAFRGVNLPRLFYALRDLQEVKKGEFEKTDVFQERLRKRLASPIYGEIRVDSALAVSLSATPVYDADSQTLRARVDFDTRDWIFSTGEIGGVNFIKSAFETAPELVPPLFRTGETVVEKTYFVLWFTDLAALTSRVNGAKGIGAATDNALTLNVRVSPETAAQMKGRWRLACVINLAPAAVSKASAPRFTVETAYQGDAPFRERYLGVLARIKSVWLYDGESGKVYGRL